MAMSPADLRRRRMSMLMAMSYATFSSTKWTPAQLFTLGQVGAWYDPSDLTTMFQDTSGTTRVTAVGQPVAMIRDKSGRGNHATQSTAGFCPTLQVDANGNYYLAFDGSDDFLVSPSIVWPGPYSVWAGFNAANVTGLKAIADADTGVDPRMPQFLRLNGNSLDSVAFTTNGAATDSGPAASAATNYVASVNCLPDSLDVRSNRISNGSTALTGTLRNATQPVYIGKFASLSSYMNGRIYNVVVRGSSASTLEIEQCEAWINAKTRAY